VNPVNLYGATKLAAESCFIQSNSYAGAWPRASAACATETWSQPGQRGASVPQTRENGTITITDDRMTPSGLSLEQGVRFVIRCTEQMLGGEVFVPKIPSMKVVDLAQAVAPEAKITPSASDRARSCMRC